jgi:ubiquinone/menaquinone biosynthesis C-methylase UbiE
MQPVVNNDELIRDYFNRMAAAWDTTAAENNTAKLTAMVARLDIPPGATVMDAGTGTGILIPLLLEKITPAGHLFALDFADEMVRIARGKGFPGHIDYLVAPITAVPLPEAVLDVVVCYSCFPHFHDKAGALREMNRLLKKGGTLYICHTSGRAAINRLHHGIAILSEDRLPDSDEMRRLLAAGGFCDVVIRDDDESYELRARKNVSG